MWNKRNVLSILRKTGPWASSILMFASLALLIWQMHTTYLSLTNYHDSLVHIVSGEVFICGFEYPAGPIKCWYALFTFFTVILLPYTALARWMNQRKTRSAYWSFVVPTVALYLYLLLILTLPFSWLIQYIVTMGITPKRIYGLAYGFAGYILILTFLYWAVRFKKPKILHNQNP